MDPKEWAPPRSISITWEGERTANSRAWGGAQHAASIIPPGGSDTGVSTRSANATHRETTTTKSQVLGKFRELAKEIQPLSQKKSRPGGASSLGNQRGPSVRGTKEKAMIFIAPWNRALNLASVPV